jgi:tetratricopeptide (TPR) repeat protein
VGLHKAVTNSIEYKEKIMKKQITAAIIGIMIIVAGATVAQVCHISFAKAALAQTQQPKVQISKASATTKFIRSLTPAQKAGLSQSFRYFDAARAAMNSGNYAEAEADARQCERVRPETGLEQDTLAASLYAQGKTQEALQVYKEIADEGGDFPRNLLPYALLSLKAGHWVQAVDAYNKALPHLGFGDLMRKNSDFAPDDVQPAELEAAIEIGMGLTGEGADFHGTYQQRSEEAQTYFQKALALEPDSPLANYYSGYGLQQMGHWQEAQTAFKKAAALDSNGAVKAAAEAALEGR